MNLFYRSLPYIALAVIIGPYYRALAAIPQRRHETGLCATTTPAWAISAVASATFDPAASFTTTEESLYQLNHALEQIDLRLGGDLRYCSPVREALKELYEQSDDFTQTIIDQALNTPGFKIIVRDSAPNGQAQTQEYNPWVNGIIINFDATYGSKGQLRSALRHEFLHAFMVSAARNLYQYEYFTMSSSPRPLFYAPEDQKEAIATELTTLFKDVERNLENMLKKKLPIDKKWQQAFDMISSQDCQTEDGVYFRPGVNVISSEDYGYAKKNKQGYIIFKDEVFFTQVTEHDVHEEAGDYRAFITYNDKNLHLLATLYHSFKFYQDRVDGVTITTEEKVRQEYIAVLVQSLPHPALRKVAPKTTARLKKLSKDNQAKQESATHVPANEAMFSTNYIECALFMNRIIEQTDYFEGKDNPASFKKYLAEVVEYEYNDLYATAIKAIRYVRAEKDVSTKLDKYLQQQLATLLDLIPAERAMHHDLIKKFK